MIFCNFCKYNGTGHWCSKNKKTLTPERDLDTKEIKYPEACPLKKRWSIDELQEKTIFVYGGKAIAEWTEETSKHFPHIYSVRHMSKLTKTEMDGLYRIVPTYEMIKRGDLK